MTRRAQIATGARNRPGIKPATGPGTACPEISDESAIPLTCMALACETNSVRSSAFVPVSNSRCSADSAAVGVSGTGAAAFSSLGARRIMPSAGASGNSSAASSAMLEGKGLKNDPVRRRQTHHTHTIFISSTENRSDCTHAKEVMPLSK